MRHIKRTLLALSGLVVIIATGCGGYKGTILDPPIPVSDFILDTANGSMFQLSDYKGKVVLLYFGYTYCPGVCPATLHQVDLAMGRLGDRAAQVQVVMVTVDPERDTPEQLGTCLGNINESFIGLRTGDADQLGQVMSQFGAFYEIEDTSEESATGYLISHTASVFVIDQEMRWRGLFPFGTTADDMANDIRLILRGW